MAAWRQTRRSHPVVEWPTPANWRSRSVSRDSPSSTTGLSGITVRLPHLSWNSLLYINWFQLVSWGKQGLWKAKGAILHGSSLPIRCSVRWMSDAGAKVSNTGSIGRLWAWGVLLGASFFYPGPGFYNFEFHCENDRPGGMPGGSLLGGGGE